MLKVYVTGLIYLNGCEEAERRMYAPDATDSEPPHYASLWIGADQIDESGTEWWPDFKFLHSVDGTDVIEFRIPSSAKIWFPDQGNAVSCIDLDTKLPKLKRKKQNGTEEDFEVDPPTAETIAEVLVRGGEIRPLRFKNLGLVQWTIDNPSALEIIAVLTEDADESRITLNAPEEGSCDGNRFLEHARSLRG